MYVTRGEYKGKPMIYIYSTKEDMEAAKSGARVRPAFGCGVRKAETILAHLPEILEFVTDHGEVSVKVIEAIEGLKK